MTTRERTAVSLATVRERVKHRRWPTEIVDKFLAAEIVTHPLASPTAPGRLDRVARRFQSWRVSGESYAAILSTLRR